jgi:hypothetical protein
MAKSQARLMLLNEVVFILCDRPGMSHRCKSSLRIADNQNETLEDYTPQGFDPTCNLYPG